MVDLVAAAAGVLTTYAPPAIVYKLYVSPHCHVAHLLSWLSGGIHLLAGLAGPDAGRMALHRRLAAESACVSRMLGDFDLLDLFAEGGTVTARKDLSALSPAKFFFSRQWLRAAGQDRTYRVPYLPVMPTFLVRFVIAAVLSVEQ